MLLKKIFKPKWQSHNPEIRHAAISQLDWDTDEDRKILESAIFRDPEHSIVTLALSKITQVSEILRIIKKTAESNQAVARARLIQIVEGAQDDTDRFVGHALQNGNTDVLIELATELKEDSHLPQLLAKLAEKSATLIATLTIDHPLSQVRQMAAEQIEEPELLANVAAKIKTKDKGVYQKVKAKLQAFRQKEQEIASQLKGLQNLCSSIEAHAETEVTKYYIEKLKTLERSHTEFKPVDDEQHGVSNEVDSLQSRIESALAKCRRRASELEQLIEADQKQQLEFEQQAVERHSAIEALQNAITQLKESPAGNLGELAAINGLINTQQIRWREATIGQIASKKEEQAFQLATRELNHYVNAQKNLINHSAEISDLLEVAQAKLESGRPVDRNLLQKLRKCVNKVEWPEGFGLPELLQRSEQVAGQIQTIQTQHTEDLGKLRKKTEGKIGKLEDHIANGELKQALRLSKTIHSELHHFPLKIKQQLNNQLKIQQIRLDELKDWQGYATLPKQRNLCDRMEYLAGQHLEPHIKAQRIKELQAEWRALGGSPDQKLWQKFKKFADQAFEPCREFFGEEDKLKEANLEKRKAICDQLAEFTEQIDWDAPDWKAVDKINKKAREEWRLYYPVDHKSCKPLQLRFNQLLSALDERLNKERDNNHRSKRNIVEQANLLLEIENTKEATTKAKNLQKQWQLVGITDHKTDRELWTAFRKACDKIFGKLEVRQKEQRKEQEKALSRASELTQATIELCDNVDDSTESALASFIETFAQIEGMEESQKAADRKFREAVNQVNQALAKHKAEAFRNYYENLINYAFSKSAGDDSRTSANSETHSVTTSDSSLIKIRPEHQALLASSPDQGKEPASDVLLRMEILAEIESPELEKGRRMALQVARLAEGLAGGNTKDVSLLSQFETYFNHWIEMSPASELQENQHRRLLTILNSIANRLTSE